VLKRASLEEMFVAQLPAGQEGADRVSIGLNFFVEERDGLRVIGHSGGQNGFVSHFYVCPALRAAYIVAFNTDWESENEAADRTRIFDAALRSYLFTRVFPGLKTTPTPPAAPGRR
jgi:hypothetical protein